MAAKWVAKTAHLRVAQSGSLTAVWTAAWRADSKVVASAGRWAAQRDDPLEKHLAGLSVERKVAKRVVPRVATKVDQTVDYLAGR